MNDYSNFIKNTSHFQPRLIVEVAGEDVSGLLVDDHSVTTDALLDTPTFNIYTTAVARFCLDNSNNQFNFKESPNFFTALGLPASGWQATVKISVVFENEDAPDDPRVMFVGYIEDITELSGERWVSLLVLDKSGLLQHRVVEDFGRVVRANISGIDIGTDYTDAVPVFNLPANSTPVSRNSFSAGIYNGVIFKVLPSLPLSGEYASYLYAGLDENTGELLLGAKPPDGATTILSIGYKAAYRYRTPEALVFLLLQASGILDDLTEDEIVFAKSLIASPELEHTRPQWSSHGRPQVGDTALDTPVVRWIVSSDSVFYHGGNRKFFKYERRDDAVGVLDEYTLLSECPDTDASILQFVIEGSDFYVLTVNTFDGVSAKLWKVDNGETWGEIAGANATAAHFYDYISQRDLVADNRKSFVVHSGWLYFLSVSSVRRYELSSGTLETVYSGFSLGQGVNTEYSWDFVIHSGSLYVFLAQRPDKMDTLFKVYRMGVDGLGVTELYSEIFERAKRVEPACVSDIVVRGSSFYFILTFSRRENRSGYSELCQMPVSGSGRTTLKLYEQSLFSGRSLVVHREDSVDNIYLVEGAWISKFFDSDPEDYPTAEDSGHLVRIDSSDILVDLGLVWQSFRSIDGRGQHTAFASNLWRDSDSETLHCVAGYGLLADARLDSIASLGLGEVESPGNWVWLQYGRQLSVKVPVFPTNDRTVWSLLEELAWTVDFEVGFTSGQDEIALFNDMYSGLVLDSKGYLFFRARSPKLSSVRIDESHALSVESTLDTTLVFNYISVPFGNGAPWISKDDVLIESDGVLWHPVRTRLLQNESFAWAEVIGDRVLERQKELRLKTRVPLKFSPHLELGQRIELTSEYHSLDNVPYKLTQVQHNVNLWQTEIEAREDFGVIELLMLPDILDYHFVAGDNVSEVLPGASGGVSPYGYELLDTPSWVSFTMGTLRFSGTAVVGEWLLFYRVRDDSGRVAERTFWLIVSPLPGELTFGEKTIPDVVHQVECQIPQIVLPEASGGVKPLRYTLTGLPDGYEYDSAALTIDGVPEDSGAVAMGYDVEDLNPAGAASARLSFYLIREPQSVWSGFGYIGQKSVWLDKKTNEGRVYTETGRDITQDVMGNSVVLNFDLGTGTYLDADGDGTFFMALEGPTRQLRLWSTSGVAQPLIQLPVGDWVACAMTPTRRYGLNTSGELGLCIHGYSTTGSELVAERVLLDFNAPFESMAVHNGIVYVLVLGSHIILAWSLTTKEMSPAHFKELPRGSTDYVAITVKDGMIHAIRENSESFETVSL